MSNNLFSHFRETVSKIYLFIPGIKVETSSIYVQQINPVNVSYLY